MVSARIVTSQFGTESLRSRPIRLRGGRRSRGRSRHPIAPYRSRRQAVRCPRSGDRPAFAVSVMLSATGLTAGCARNPGDIRREFDQRRMRHACCRAVRHSAQECDQQNNSATHPTANTSGRRIKPRIILLSDLGRDGIPRLPDESARGEDVGQEQSRQWLASATVRKIKQWRARLLVRAGVGGARRDRALAVSMARFGWSQRAAVIATKSSVTTARSSERERAVTLMSGPLVASNQELK